MSEETFLGETNEHKGNKFVNFLFTFPFLEPSVLRVLNAILTNDHCHLFENSQVFYMKMEQRMWTDRYTRTKPRDLFIVCLIKK